MKVFYPLIFCVLSIGLISGQETKTFPNKNGSSTTVTITQDEQLRKVYTVENKDKYDRVIRKRKYSEDLKGEREVEVEVKRYATKDGNSKRTEYSKFKFKFDREGKLLRIEETFKGGTKIYRPDQDGDFVDSEGKKIWTGEDGSTREITECIENEYNKEFKWLKEVEGGDSPTPPDSTSCIPNDTTGDNCNQKLALFVGPSFLSGEVGSENESFFGGHIYGLYQINSHFGIGPDFSLHYKKDGNAEFTRSFILARGQYDFFEGDKCEKTVVPEVHIVLGLGLESFKVSFGGTSNKSTGNGFAYGAGAGLGFKLSHNLDLGVSVDYIGISFEGSDGTNSNIRASAGLKFKFNTGG